MDITEFFQQSAGKWASQRTSHHLSQNQAKAAKSELVIEVLTKDDPAVVQLCQQQAIEAASVLCGLKISWNGTADGDPKPQVGSSLLVAVPDTDQPNQGRLLSQINRAAKPIMGRYSLAEDEVLTLTAEDGNLQSEERIWFANPNFRLRTSVVKQTDGFDLASFCSEIRMGGAPPAAKPTAAEATS